jgi:hypothetical protein
VRFIFIIPLAAPSEESSFLRIYHRGVVLPPSVYVFPAMAQKWYLAIQKLAEKVGRTAETRMVNYAGEILHVGLGLIPILLARLDAQWTG